MQVRCMSQDCFSAVCLRLLMFLDVSRIEDDELSQACRISPALSASSDVSLCLSITLPTGDAQTEMYGLTLCGYFVSGKIFGRRPRQYRAVAPSELQKTAEGIPCPTVKSSRESIPRQTKTPQPKAFRRIADVLMFEFADADDVLMLWNRYSTISV